MMANVHVAPRVTNVMHILYFIRRPSLDFDTHVAKFEITCTTNDVPTAKIQEIFTTSLQENAFAWYQKQPPFGKWNALKDVFLAHFRPLSFAMSFKNICVLLGWASMKELIIIMAKCNLSCSV